MDATCIGYVFRHGEESSGRCLSITGVMKSRVFRSAVCAVLVLFSSLEAGAGCPEFVSPRGYWLGPGITSALFADVNSDGRPDLVTVQSFGYASFSYVAVWLNTEGLPRRVGLTSAGEAFRDMRIAVGDLDGDGRVDIAASDPNGGRVAVLRGNGNGTFNEPIFYTVGNRPSPVLIADVDGNKTPDLVVGNLASNDIAVLLNRGPRLLFDSPMRFVTGIAPEALASGDLNHDGRADIVAINRDANSLVLLPGAINGSFGSSETYAVGNGPVSIIVGDFENDGVQRAAVLARYGGSLDLLSVGEGGRLELTARYNTAGDPISLAAADLNGDGKTDFAFVDPRLAELSVVLSKPAGRERVDFSASRNAAIVLIADLTSDRVQDVFLINDFGYDTDAMIIAGRGDGDFDAPRRYGLPPEPFSLAAADFNGDGKTDLVAASRGDSASAGVVTLFHGTAQGTLVMQGQYIAGRTPIAVVTSDFNHDGKADFAVANEAASEVYVFLQIEHGIFSRSERHSVGRSPWSLAAGDLNGDGSIDLATANRGDGTVTVLLSDGRGGFQKAADISVAKDVIAVNTGDFDGDGDVDIAALTYNPGSLAVLLNEGNGRFGTPVFYSTGVEIYENIAMFISVGDLNQDGIADLAIGGSLGQFFLGSPDGKLKRQTRAPSTGPVAIADVSHDDLQDFVFVDFNDLYVSICLGVDDGTHPSCSGVAAVGPSPSAIAAGDFNGDGRADLAVASQFAGDVAILLNRSRCIEIHTIEPASGPWTGGQRVTITGAYLRQSDDVTFGSTPGQLLEIADDRLVVMTPAHSPGTVDVAISAFDHNPGPKRRAYTYVIDAAAIPALDSLGLIALGLLLAVVGICAIRRIV
jgi:VCBS repeat protein/IPT/TIG domain-containing protein/FG-GAP repeat protein